jgi:hypothetical protein
MEVLNRHDEDVFLDLVCQDDELVRDEFDALIAASWHTPPPPPPALPEPSDRPPGWPCPPLPAPRRQPGAAPPSRAGTRRQRSPP